MDFGTLSLEQVRAIDRAGDAFEAAWRGGGRPRIEEALVGVDAGARPALFDVLLGVELECRRRRGEPVSAGEYLSRFPDRLAKVDAAFATVQTDPHDDETVTRGAVPPAGSEGRYRVIREHGKGGLGIVYLAHDSELNREVALKEIRPGRSDDPDSRARFLLEAEITGRLEHPGIIPVHSLGRREDGRPYYVMRFIKGAEGKDLGEAIRRLHEPDGDGDGSAARVAPGLAARLPAARGLLARYVGLCNAIGYAHSRKVIHRDIKPSNVLLGPFGETLVIDWGLVKTVESGGATPTAAEGTIRGAAADSATPTRQGEVSGTPGYMSPEQAEGRVDRIGPASDIFLLGATLYQILTGSCPYPGGQDRARAWDFRRPREADPTIPKPLESICLKAMARLPEDRYASATDLARDVERWLADEPVSARRESRVERLSRWSRRHRAWVRAGAAAVAAVAAVAVASALLIGRAWGETNRALDKERVAREGEREAGAKAEAEHVRAEANYGQALVAMGDVLDVADGTLAGVPGLDEAREGLAGKALQQLATLLARHPDDPPARLATAQAYRLVGNIRRARVRFAQADESHGRAVGLLEGLAAEFPGTPLYRDRLAEILFDRGETFRMGGHPPLAEPILRRALAEATRLAEEAPGNVPYRLTKARCLWTLGVCLVALGEAEAHDGADMLDQAVRLFEPIADKPGAGLSLAIQYVSLLGDRGRALREDKRVAQAREALRIAIRKVGTLALAHPRVADIRFVQADIRAETGRALAAVDSDDDKFRESALKPFGDAIADFTALRVDFKRNRHYQRSLALALDDRGAVLLRLGRLDAAAADFQAALPLLVALRDEAPESAAHDGPLGRLAAHRARLALARKDPVAARGLFEEAASRHEAARKANPRSPSDLRGATEARKEAAQLPPGP